MPILDQLELLKRESDTTGRRNSDISIVSRNTPPDSTDSAKDGIAISKFAAQRAAYDFNKEAEWIKRRKIQCRTCTRYVPTKTFTGGSEKVICGCGYHKDRHDRSSIAPSSPISDTLPSFAEWNQKSDTRPYPTDAFGEMEFVGSGQRFAKYIRVDVDTDIQVMWQYMTRVWKLKPPNLVISVTGGAKNFNMTPKLKEVFRKGLIKAALCTDAWITSSGTHAGVMKYVGEAVRDLIMGQASQCRVVALGIAPWGCVQNKEMLRESNGNVRYRINTNGYRGETPLDCNHSHFILVDDGTQHKFAVEIPFRAKLEKTIAEKSSFHTADKVKVPIILVVVEGGPGTLQTVYNSIQEQTPAVIISGSGRAANILSYAIENSHEHVFEESSQQGEKIKRKVLVMNNSVEMEVRQMFSNVFNEKSETKLNGLVDWVKQCLQFPDLLTVYQLDSSRSVKDIDLAMLKALLKANHEQVLEQLKLALIWNRVDIAKSEIFTDDRNFKTGALDEVMFSAIILNRVDFVQVLLENGISLRDFLSVEVLLKLYSQIPRKSLLHDLLWKSRKDKHKDYVSLHDVGCVIRCLMGDFYQPHYLRHKTEEHEDITPNLDSPERDLFIFSILMGRCKMARVFWEEGKDSLPAALVANSLLKAMRQRTGDNELKQKLQREALEFQQLAVGILRECYEDEDERTFRLLVRPLEYWGETNCVSIAIESNNKEFIAQSACQELFNTVWWGQMDINNGIKILPCVLVPPLALACLAFRKENIGFLNGSAVTKSTDNSTTYKDGYAMGSSLRDQSLTHQSTMDIFRFQREKRPLDKMKCFFQAPVTKFCYTVAFFLVFLLLFSYVMLIEFHPKVSAAEIVLIFWVFTVAIEETRQLWKSSPGPLWIRTINYLSDRWNILDVVTVTMFCVGIILRFVPHTDTFIAARIILSINLFTFFLRLLHIFSVSKNMGPKLVMIGRMLRDLVSFMLIMLVFIVGYGITSQAILYPNTELNAMIVVDVLKKAYWQMFAELFLEEIEGKEDCVENMAAYTNGTHVRCPSEFGKVLVPILLGFYMLLIHVLLLSLLIAVFTNTFEAVQANTDLHWHFQRYKLVYEYHERPVLPPPFIIFSHIYRIMRFFIAGCETNVMYGFLSEKGDSPETDSKTLELFEENKRDEFMWQRKQMLMLTTDFKVDKSAERLAALESKVDDIHEHLSAADADQSSSDNIQELEVADRPRNGRRRALREGINNLDKQVKNIQDSLDGLIRYMHDSSSFTFNDVLPRLSTTTAAEETTEEGQDTDGFDSNLLRKIPLMRQTTSVETSSLVPIKSRTSPYPDSSVIRVDIPENVTDWEVPYPRYNPDIFTHQDVLDRPAWADKDIGDCEGIAWNEYDGTVGLNRVSYQGEYQIVNGFPLNPIGRTGLRGRGCLGRWGPNHAADPIVTRWKLDHNNQVVLRDGSPVLEFVAVRRHDNKHWALPGGFIGTNESFDATAQRRLVDESMAYLQDGDRERKDVQFSLTKLFANSAEVYTGYVDDERNTDNAWIETRAVNYHDEDGSLTKDLPLKAGKTEDAAAWLPIWSKIPMQANHCFILERVAEMRNAAF